MIRLADIDLTNRTRILNLKNPVDVKEPVPLGYGDSRYALQAFTVNGHNLSGPLEITASEVPVNSTSNLSSTTVQTALEELQEGIDNHDLNLHSVTELNDVTSVGSGAIITTVERSKLENITITNPVDLDTLESDVATNNAKETNVTTDLSIANITNSNLDVASSDGTNATLPSVTTTAAGLLTGTDKTKLDTIEEGADVTDALNVETAGAVMETDATTANMNFVVDENNMTSDSNTKIPTQQSVKAYIDNAAKEYIYFDGTNMAVSVVGAIGHVYKNSARLDNSDEEASTSSYNTYSNGLLTPFRAYETIDIIKVGVSCKAVCVNSGTIGASPTMRFALYTMSGTTRALVGNIDIPVSPTGSIGVYGNLGGTTLIEGEVSIPLSTLSLTNKQLFGVEFISRGTTNEEVYGFAKMTMYIKGQKI
jgi:hypothetical protein